MPLSHVSVSVVVDVWPSEDVVEEPAVDVDPSGELASVVDDAIVPDGAACEAGAMVPDGADDGVEAEPDGVIAFDALALV